MLTAGNKKYAQNELSLPILNQLNKIIKWL
jgi:hypothetical protein